MKAFEHFTDERDVAQKRGIEAQIFFESEGEEAAGQLEGPDGAVFDDGLGADLRRERTERADCDAARRPQSGGWCGRPRSLRETSQGNRRHVERERSCWERVSELAS